LTTAFIGQTGAVQSTTIGQASSTLSDLLGQPAPDGAGLIVVEFGTKEAYAGALPMFTSNYSTYLDELTTASPKAAIVCLGTWTYSTLGGAFDAAIKTACTQHDGIYIKLADLYTAVGNPYRATLGSSWSGGKVPDAVHANDAGNRSVSDRIVAALLTS
jgi:lysophospholipase L1-like esterase